MAAECSIKCLCNNSSLDGVFIRVQLGKQKPLWVFSVEKFNRVGCTGDGRGENRKLFDSWAGVPVGGGRVPDVRSQDHGEGCSTQAGTTGMTVPRSWSCGRHSYCRGATGSRERWETPPGLFLSPALLPLCLLLDKMALLWPEVRRVEECLSL